MGRPRTGKVIAVGSLGLESRYPGLQREKVSRPEREQVEITSSILAIQIILDFGSSHLIVRILLIGMR